MSHRLNRYDFSNSIFFIIDDKGKEIPVKVPSLKSYLVGNGFKDSMGQLIAKKTEIDFDGVDFWPLGGKPAQSTVQAPTTKTGTLPDIEYLFDQTKYDSKFLCKKIDGGCGGNETVSGVGSSKQGSSLLYQEELVGDARRSRGPELVSMGEHKASGCRVPMCYNNTLNRKTLLNNAGFINMNGKKPCLAPFKGNILLTNCSEDYASKYFKFLCLIRHFSGRSYDVVDVSKAVSSVYNSQSTWPDYTAYDLSCLFIDTPASDAQCVNVITEILRRRNIDRKNSCVWVKHYDGFYKNALSKITQNFVVL
jgi:hypothetical protein